MLTTKLIWNHIALWWSLNFHGTSSLRWENIISLKFDSNLFK